MLQVKSKIIHNGKTYRPKEIIENINDKEATRLVNLGVAFFVETIPTNHGNTKQINKVDKEDAEELDKAYKLNELRDMAKHIGMNFDEKITKNNLINQIVSEGRINDFFIEEDN